MSFTKHDVTKRLKTLTPIPIFKTKKLGGEILRTNTRHFHYSCANNHFNVIWIKRGEISSEKQTALLTKRKKQNKMEKMNPWNAIYWYTLLQPGR